MPASDTAPPSYADVMRCRHRAHESTFRRVVAAMPVPRGARCLDVGCGDGSWPRWLADRVGTDGEVVGLDVDPGFLSMARRLTPRSGGAAISFVRGDALDLPYEDGSFDVVTSCHCMYDYDDPHRALQEMSRVTRPGGAVVLVTADLLQHAQLPWPIELEAACCQALAQATRATEDRRPFLPRYAPHLLAELGFEDICHETFTTTTQGPMTRDERFYLRGWLDELWSRAAPFLGKPRHEALRRWVEAVNQRASTETFAVVFADNLTYGFRPTG